MNAVAPGVCDTDMTTAAGEEIVAFLVKKTPLGRIGRPEEIAPVAVFLATINVVGGYVVTDRMLAMFKKKPGGK